MKKRSQLSHRYKEISGQHYYQKTSGQVYPALHKLRNGHYYSCRCSSVSYQVHYRYGIELHGKNLHGDAAEFFGFFVHLIIFEFIRLIYLEGSQTLKILKERISQSRVLTPIFWQQFFSPRLYGCDGYGNERNAYEQNCSRRQVYKAHISKQRQRRYHGVEKLRQISWKVSLKLIYPFHCHLYDLAGLNLLVVRGSYAQKLCVYLFS